MPETDDSRPVAPEAVGAGASADTADRFRRGEPEAVEQVRARVRRILSYGRLGIPTEDRRDLEQETMTQLWQTANRASFQAQGGFWSLIETVTTRRSIDWLRRRREQQELPEALPDERRGPAETALSIERSKLAMDALARLDRPCRELIYMHATLDKSYAELAVLLGRSEGSLRVRMHRCIGKARTILDQLQMGTQGKSSPSRKNRG